jgi:hypothetical protein
MAHEFNVFVHTPTFGVSCQESVKPNDKQASFDRHLNLLNADNNRAPTSSGCPSFYVVIASGMSSVHGLSLSETYRVRLKGRECSFVSEYLLFTYSPGPVVRDTFRRLLSSSKSSDNKWLARRFPDDHRKLDGPPFHHSSIQSLQQKLNFAFTHVFGSG